MSLKTMLGGSNDKNLLTAKDYRIGVALRIRAGQALTVLTPLAALGSVINDPILAIPALYVAAAYGSGIEIFKAPFVKLAGSRHFWRTLGIGTAIFTVWELWPVVLSWFAAPNPYAPYVRAEARHVAAEYQFWLLIVGLSLSLGMGGLSYLFMKGGRTRAMQRIAQHLAIQEAKNA